MNPGTYFTDWDTVHRTEMRLGLIAVLLLPAIILPHTVHGRVGPEGRIRAICFGDVIDQYGGFNSFVVIRIDPAIDPTLVPSRPDYLGSYENALRNMRIYMPRSYRQLVDGFDLILTSDADRMVFRTDWIDWMGRSVSSGGLSLEWLGSIQSNSFPSWEDTTLAEVVPCKPAPHLDVGQAFRVRVWNEGEPLMQSLPWEASPPLANVNTQIPKDGSQLWAKVFSTSSEYPLVTYWELGEGASMCFASKFPNGVKPWARGWAYFPQAMVYLVYRTSGKELPADPLLFAGVIESLEQHSERSSTVDSIFAFVERFGGNLNRLYARVDEISLQKAEADRVYLEGDYSLCQEVLGEVAAMQMEVMEEALKAKDAALFWVYVTEWCAMTGTMLISGVILWTLMVKRRLYREVGISRQAGDRLG